MAHREELTDEDEKRYVEKMRKSMNQFYGYLSGDATKIFDFLYLGGAGDATDLPLLAKLGITHVINCASGDCSTGTKFYGNTIRRYVEFEADDDDDYDIMQHFDEAQKVIEDARKTGGRALIHCQMGVNRSGALAVAYVMVHQEWGPITAAAYVREKRGHILSNDGFRLQLIKFAQARNLLKLDAKELDQK